MPLIRHDRGHDFEHSISTLMCEAGTNFQHTSQQAFVRVVCGSSKRPSSTRNLKFFKRDIQKIYNAT